MKKKILNIFAADIAAKKKSLNSLDGDARALMEETIATLQQAYEELEAEEDERGVDDVVNRVRDIVDEKINAALEKVKDIETTDNETVAENYLKSRNSLRDFAALVRTTKNAGEFRQGWRDTLKKNGVTIDTGSESAFLPDAVKGMIDDSWTAETGWLRNLTNTGAKRYAYRYNIDVQEADSVRAKGHKKGALKNEQEVTLAAKIFDVQAIYKKQALDKQTIYENDEALVRYIVDELTKQVRYEIARAILIGDGRTASDPDKITSFETIDRTASDDYVTISNVAAGSTPNVLEVFMDNLIKPIYNGEGITLFVNKDDLFDLRKYVHAAGGTTTYSSIDEVKAMLGVEDIVVLPYLDSSSTGAARAIALHTKRYYTVGDMSDFVFVNYPDWDYNREKYLCETYAGGGVGINAAAVIRNN